jgi:predicted phosphodiesterase
MPTVIVSDLHSNIEALQAVLRDAEARGAVDAVWCAGDIVGYGPDPGAVIETLRAANAIVVAGNHDLAATGAMGIEEFNPVAAEAVVWTQKRLLPNDTVFLEALPLIVEPEERFVMVHGSLRQPQWEYLLSAEQGRAQFELQTTPYSIVGHSHLQFWMEERPNGIPASRMASDGAMLALGATRLIINPGSVGQPRDGDPRAGYVLYDAAASTVTWHRVEYDVTATQRKIADAGLPPYLGARLVTGR